ncbi:MAG TPA: flagellar basal body P-ring protein FlgI [Planctomycetes bacterium]|nr:flagellar basal body P-ring protein FlgI [Planctomycetota bacterium]
MKKRTLITCLLLASALPAQANRSEPKIKLREILRIQGIRENRLEGIGLITGLKGTGDGTVAARQALVNYLARRGLKVRTDAVASGNIALVRIEATLPPFAHHGTKMDVIVSSLGEATSLRGGTLLTTELRDESGREIFALAGGPILIGGFQAKGSNAKVTRNHPTVGVLPGGAICEPTVEDIQVKLLNDKGELCFIVSQRSFETVRRAAKAINDLLIKKRIGYARIQDENLICLNLDRAWRERDALNKLIAEVFDLSIQPAPIAKVILDEKTGTIIIGQDVRLSPCIIQVADLTIQVVEDDLVSQPLPGINQGKTTKVRQTKIDVTVKGGKPKKVGGGGSLNDLLESLQALGVDGQKLITILHRLHDAGYLHAELVTK